MHEPSAPPEPQLRRFRRLLYATAATTFLLIVVGGIVRVGDSGLGCGPAGAGVQGWPLCRGGLVPGSQTHPIVEYTHRFLAAIVVVLLAAILVQALRRFRARRPVVRLAAAAMLVVVVQAVLGGLTVEHGLETALVAAHLGTAMLLLALLIGLIAITRPRPATAPPSRALLAAAATACALLLATIVAGGVIAGTERHGTVGEDAAAGAHLACGKEFPTCNGAVLPFGSGEMVDIQLAHRTAMLLAVLAIVAFVALLARQRRLERLRLAIVAALAAQVLLGAANVWFGEHPALIVAHLTLATLLWVLVASSAAALAAARSRRGRYGAGGDPASPASTRRAAPAGA